MSGKGWGRFDYPGFFDIVPLEDIKGHYLGDECWCSPKTEHENGMVMVVHNSADGREAMERGQDGYSAISTQR